MKKVSGEIILIDEQKYEKEIMSVTLDQLRYEIHIKYLNRAEDALDYLKHSRKEIFLIIADYNLSEREGGFHLKKIIDADPELKSKSVPFVFSCAEPTKQEIDKAYQYNIQGFFKKPQSMEKLNVILDVIIKYWVINKHPNKLEEVFEQEHQST